MGILNSNLNSVLRPNLSPVLGICEPYSVGATWLNSYSPDEQAIINALELNSCDAFANTDNNPLRGWYDSADTSIITESLGAVSQQSDKSGFEEHLVQSTSSKQPLTNIGTINGKNIIRYDGIDDAMARLGFIASPNMSVFIVSKVTSLNHTNDGLLSMNANNDFQIEAGSFVEFLGRFASSGLGATTPPISSTDLVGSTSLITYKLSADDSDVILRINGSQEDTDTYNGALDTVQNLYVCSNRATNQNTGADVAEIIIVNKDLTLQEIQDLEGYLINKWGI